MEQRKLNIYDRIINWIEAAGNKLPDPVTLFVIFCVLVMILSAWLASAGVSVVHPSTHKTVIAVNLLEREQLQRILGSIVNNFQGFPPLGLVLVTMLGVGLADKTGFMETAMKHLVTKVPDNLVIFTIIFAGICANAAGDAGFIVLPPLAAVVFHAMGRHPLAGIFAAYGGVAAGFSANIMVTMTDVLAASFTIPAAQVVVPSYQGTPAMNYYFILASTLILLIVGVIINNKFVEPRLGTYVATSEIKEASTQLTDTQQKGLKWAYISVFVFLGFVALLCIGEHAFLAEPKTGSLLAYKSPLMQGIIPLIAGLFFIPGLVYGMITGSVKSDKDVVAMIGKSMSEMGPYIVLAFMAAQFLAFFKDSNMGVILSVKGAEFLKDAGFTGYGLIISFIVLSCCINLFVGSASAKWAIMAPVFVPMFLLLGYDPALTQMAYRIGDSVTNAISPLFPYFPIIVAFARQYDKEVGMGTIIANMTPYSVGFFIVWTLVLILFMVFNLPLGPGAGIYYKI